MQESVPTLASVRIYDLRALQADPPPKTKQVRGKVVRRNPRTITGIVLHQTAVEFGVSRAQLKRADGDRELARAHRGLNVACHAMAFRGGFVAITNHPSIYVWQANKLNATTVGIEVEGLYPGLESSVKATTWSGRSPTAREEQTLNAAKVAVRELLRVCTDVGCNIDRIYAHRQSSGTRRNDPGEWLWKEVVLGYATTELGLRVENDFTIDNGRPIPAQWDACAKAPY